MIINDTKGYQLAYDNLSGFPSKYKYFGTLEAYNKNGIRIKINNASDKTSLLKLLHYSIENITELKRHRRYLLKTNSDESLKSVSLPQDKLISIIKSPFPENLSQENK